MGDDLHDSTSIFSIHAETFYSGAGEDKRGERGSDRAGRGW